MKLKKIASIIVTAAVMLISQMTGLFAVAAYAAESRLPTEIFAPDLYVGSVYYPDFFTLKYDGKGRITEIKEYYCSESTTTFSEAAKEKKELYRVLKIKYKSDTSFTVTELSDYYEGSAQTKKVYNCKNDKNGNITRTELVKYYEYDNGKFTEPAYKLDFVKTFKYDSDGRLIKDANKGGAEPDTVNTYTYDSNGNMIRHKSATEYYTGTEVFEYDGKGNLLTRTFDTSKYTYTYDGSGKCKTAHYHNDINGYVTDLTVNFSYDSKGNIISAVPEGRPDSAINITNTYDKNGRLKSAVSDYSLNFYGYDNYNYAYYADGSLKSWRIAYCGRKYMFAQKCKTQNVSKSALNLNSMLLEGKMLYYSKTDYGKMSPPEVTPDDLLWVLIQRCAN